MLWWIIGWAGAAPLGFDDAVREALEHGPGAAIVASERASASADATAGAAWENPNATVQHTAEETDAYVTIAVPLALSPVAALREADALRDAADVRGEAARATAGLEAGRAYLEARRAADQAALATTTSEMAARRRDAAARLLAAREIGTIDAAALAGDAMVATSDASRAGVDAYLARLVLEATLGRTPEGAVELGGWPELARPVDVDPAGIPVVIEASDRARAAAAAWTRARLERVPAPAVSAGWRASDAGGSVFLGVSVDLPLVAPGGAPVRRARAESAGAEATARATTLDARARWLAAVAEADAADAAWRAMDPELLRTALVDLGVALDAGELSLAEYGARRDAVVTALQTSIDAHWRAEVAKIELWELAGKLP